MNIQVDFEPLLPPGLHDFEEHQIEQFFIDGFADSLTRPVLVAKFRKYLEQLKEIGIPFEVWIDGSFSTKKVDPNDVDLVVFAQKNDIDSLQELKQRKLAWLLHRESMKIEFGCDVLFSISEDTNQRSYWRGWYGFDRREQPKGIMKILVKS